MSDIKDIGLKIEAITEALRVINIVNHTDLHLDQKHIEMLKVLRVDLSEIDWSDNFKPSTLSHAGMWFKNFENDMKYEP